MENFVPGVFIKIINKSFILLKCINTWCTLTGWTEYMVYSVIAVLAKTNHFWSFIQCTYQNIVIGYTYSCRWCWKHMWHRNEQIEHLHWTLWTKTHIFKLVKNLIPQSWSVLKSSHRMKPGKGLAPHGTSYGADHLSSLVTPILGFLSRTKSRPLWTRPTPSHTSWPRPCLNCRPLIAGSFRWPRGQLLPSTLVGRDDHVIRALIGHVTGVLASHWSDPNCRGLWLAESGRCSCGNGGEEGAPALVTLWEHVSNLVNVVSINLMHIVTDQTIVKTKFIHDSWNAFELTNVFLWYRQAFALD